MKRERENNTRNGSDKKHHEAIVMHRDSPGDSGVIAGTIESGVLVIVGYDENQRQWNAGVYQARIPGINKVTGEIEGHYVVRYPNCVNPGFMTMTMLSADGVKLEGEEAVAWMAQLQSEVGAYAGSEEQIQYAGKDMPLELCTFETRPIPRNGKGKPVNRNQTPKKFGLNFLLHEVIAKMHIAPPDKPEHGVVLVGEQAGYFGRMKQKRVSWEPRKRVDLGHIPNSSYVERVFSGEKASLQDQVSVTDLLTQLSTIRPSIGDAANKAGLKISEYTWMMAHHARRDPNTPISIKYMIDGKWKNWSNKLINKVNKDIKTNSGSFKRYNESWGVAKGDRDEQGAD